MIRKLIETQTQWGGRRIGAPPKAAPVFLMILYHKYLWIFLIYSLYIPYIFPSYVKYVFPCVFLNLWSQEKTSPCRKTTFLFLFFRFYTFHIFIDNFIIFIKNLVLNPKRAKLTKTLVSGIWFLSPEAGGTAGRDSG